MTLHSFDGFSLDLPEGAQQVDEDASYSDPSEGDRKTFGLPGDSGVIYVSVLPIDPESPPSATVEHVESLARGWGRARGLKAPVSLAVSEGEGGALARAEYKLASDYIEVCFLSNDELTLQLSYVCPWSARATAQGTRDRIVSSLAFA